jgi:chromate transporter
MRIGRRALRNRVLLGITACALVAIFFLAVPFPIIVRSAGLIGFLGGRSGLPAFEPTGGHRAAQDGLADAAMLAI